MTDDEAKWFIDHRCAVAHRGGRAVLYPIYEDGGEALVFIDREDYFSALQLLDDPRPLTVRRTNLAGLLSGKTMTVRLSWPLLSHEVMPMIRRGKWGGVLLSRQRYPRPQERPLTKQQQKTINFARAYGMNLNGDNYEQAQIGIDWAVAGANWAVQHVVGVPQEMMQPERANCVAVPTWRWRMQNERL